MDSIIHAPHHDTTQLAYIPGACKEKSVTCRCGRRSIDKGLSAQYNTGCVVRLKRQKLTLSSAPAVELLLLRGIFETSLCSFSVLYNEVNDILRT